MGKGACILRVEKISTAAGLTTSLAHHLRTRDTPNADKNLTSTNISSAKTPEIALSVFRDIIKDARKQKNSVLALEYLVTVGSETWSKMTPIEQKDYFENARSWIKQKHGAENICFESVHYDETTPHLVVIAVPIITKNTAENEPERRLSARTFTGGAKLLREMQTDFYEKVGKPLGLDRGIEGSRATHTRIQTFYGNLETNDLTPKYDSKSLQQRFLESKDSYGMRVFTTAVEGMEVVSTALKDRLTAEKLKTERLNNEKTLLKDRLERESRMKIEEQNRRLTLETLVKTGDLEGLKRAVGIAPEKSRKRDTDLER